MKKISIIILLLVAILASCKKTPEVNLKYVDVERDLITVGTTTATIQCDYEYIATLKKAYLYYGEGTDTINMSLAETSVVQKTLYVELSGLKENTTYSYYYEFVNGFNSMRSATKTFKTGTTPVTPPEITLPTVVTAEVTEITTNSAQCGGEVTNDGGAEVTERGICWSTNANPTLNDNHIASGNGTGAFTAIMNSLEANTTYHVRAYATNEKGTAYGFDREFTTLSGGGGSGDAPIGAINGLFTINDNGDQVYFSQGNLQYQASTNTWRFAENQWNYVGGVDGGGNGYIKGNVYENGTQCDNGLISSTYNGWIDLFGWGTSGYNHRVQCYQPYAMTYGYPYPPDQFFHAYDNPSYNLFDESGKADWGYNAISNGGNTENQWRTPKTEEWEYLFNLRNTASGIRFAKATIIYTPIVNEMCSGVLLLPDNWDASCYQLNAVNEREADYAENYISLSDWTNIVEANGAVFLPTTGSRIDSIVSYITWEGVYWSSTTIDWMGSYDAQCLWFVTEDITPQNGFNKSGGIAVRLVQDAYR